MIHMLALIVLAAEVHSFSLAGVVAISRHGIRVPYPLKDGMGNYSMDNREWFEKPSQWGAGGTAYLTLHGSAVETEMGSYWRQEYLTDKKLLPSTCDALNNVTIYADYDTTQRDLHTAEAFFKGMYPACQPSIVNDESYTHFLFNQGQAAMNAECSGPSRDVIEGTLGNDPTRPSKFYANFIAELSDAVGCCRPVICEAFGINKATCTLNDIPTTWLGEFYQYYDSPLFRADFLSEYLQLLYLNGMAYNETTNLSPSELWRLVDVHQAGMAQTENFFATQAFGSELLAHIVATMDQIVYGTENPHLKSTVGDKLVMYFGHDINIYFLRNFLRLNWITESFNPNQSPPGGLLLFELYSVSGEHYVMAFFQTQSADQQRYVIPLTGSERPDKVYVSIPQCTSGPNNSCPFEDFRRIALASIDSRCTTFA